MCKMDPARQFLKYNKFKPVQMKSSFEMMIEDLENNKKVLSKQIQFLGSDNVWWISIHAVSGSELKSELQLEIFLRASEYIRKSGNWNYNVSGSISGRPFPSYEQYIQNKDQTSSSHRIKVLKKPILELKLEMIILLRADSNTVPFQKFIDKSVQYQNIISNNKLILNESKYSDFTFIAQGTAFKVHKCILGAASPVFGSLFTSNFGEAKSNDCQVDVNPIIFQNLLNFIYCAELPENLHEISRELFKVAHYYQINKLVDICTDVEHFSLTKDNALDLYEWADLYNLENVKLDAWKIIQFHILEIFDERLPPPPRTIRSLIAKKVEKHKLLEELQLKLSKLETDTNDLFDGKN